MNITTAAHVFLLTLLRAQKKNYSKEYFCRLNKVAAATIVARPSMVPIGISGITNPGRELGTRKPESP